MTPAGIRALKSGEVLRDDVIKGLECRAFPSGRKGFYLWFRTKLGVARHPKLGDCDVMSLADARAAARRLLLAVANGEDPIGDRRNLKSQATVGELWKSYRELHGLRKKSADGDEYLFERHVAPRFGGHRIGAVSHEDCVRLHASLADTPYLANRVLALTSTLFNFAERSLKWLPADSNPCRGVKRFAERSRRRYATPGELAAIGSALNAEAEASPESVGFLYALIYSGARPAEIGTARREWLADSVLRLPDSKTGEKPVYFPPELMALIDRVPVPEDGSLFGIKTPRRVWRRVRNAAGCPDLRMYPDLRRSFATVGVAAGNTIDLIGSLLGHKNRQTTLVYARLMEGVAKDAVAATAKRMSELLNATARNPQPSVDPSAD